MAPADEPRNVFAILRIRCLSKELIHVDGDPTSVLGIRELDGLHQCGGKRVCNVGLLCHWKAFRDDMCRHIADGNQRQVYGCFMSLQYAK